jgi:hypothetical protein
MMKSKAIVAIALSLMLSACFGRGETVVSTQYKVVKPEAAYFTCERVQLPNPDTLDDAAVAELINRLVKANRTCANNMNAIKQYLDAAEQVLEERK